MNQPTPTRANEAESELLRAEGLRKEYRAAGTDREVLRGITLRLRRGEMVAVVGPSGCGKSTLLHLLAALDTPTSGTVYFEGKGVNSFSNSELAEFRNRRIGFVWQRHHLLADFSAAENVAFPLFLRGVPGAQALATAKERLEQVGLGDRAGSSAASLSGGEQQRVALARALAGDPALLLADEPTGDLDETTAESVFELMQSLHRKQGLTSILATHNLSLARRCDRIFDLEHGLISERATAPGGTPSRIG